MFKTCNKNHTEICFNVNSWSEECPVCISVNKVDEEINALNKEIETIELEKSNYIDECEQQSKIINSLNIEIDEIKERMLKIKSFTTNINIDED